MSAPDEESDDFEYELADAEPRNTCPFCGAKLATPGNCESCGKELDLSPPPAPHAEDAEAPKPEGWGAYLEMEETGEGDLPASFYAVALGIVVVAALAAVISDSPALATLVIGILMVAGGSVALAVGYYWMHQQLGGGLGAHLATPFRAARGLIFRSHDPPPKAPSVDVAKWGIVVMMGGLVVMLAGFLIGLAY